MHNPELTDLVTLNTKLIEACETALELPLNLESIPEILEIPHDQLIKAYIAFSSAWQDMITKLETHPIQPLPDLYCPEHGFTQVDEPLIENLFLSFSRNANLAIKVMPYLLYYPRILIYSEDVDSFLEMSTFPHGEILGDTDFEPRTELMGLCLLAPLIKKGALLYLPTWKNFYEPVAYPGFNEADEAFCEREHLDPIQLAYAHLTQAHLLFENLGAFGDYLTPFYGKIRQLPEFHNMIDEATGALMQTEELYLPSKIDYPDYLSLQEEACFQNWRDTLQQTSRWSEEWADIGFASTYQFEEKTGEAFQQALDHIHTSRKDSSFLQDILTVPVGFISVYGRIILADPPEKTPLFNLFSTGNQEKYLTKHFTHLLLEDKE